MDVKVAIRQLRLSFGKKEVLKGIDLDIVKNRIYGFMGPSASGKSTLISVINKMISFEDGVAVNPDKSNPITFASDDRIIVLAEQ